MKLAFFCIGAVAAIPAMPYGPEGRRWIKINEGGQEREYEVAMGMDPNAFREQMSRVIGSFNTAPRSIYPPSSGSGFSGVASSGFSGPFGSSSVPQIPRINAATDSLVYPTVPFRPTWDAGTRQYVKLAEGMPPMEVPPGQLPLDYLDAVRSSRRFLHAEADADAEAKAEDRELGARKYSQYAPYSTGKGAIAEVVQPTASSGKGGASLAESLPRLEQISYRMGEKGEKIVVPTVTNHGQHQVAIPVQQGKKGSQHLPRIDLLPERIPYSKGIPAKPVVTKGSSAIAPGIATGGYNGGLGYKMHGNKNKHGGIGGYGKGGYQTGAIQQAPLQQTQIGKGQQQLEPIVLPPAVIPSAHAHGKGGQGLAASLQATNSISYRMGEKGQKISVPTVHTGKGGQGIPLQVVPSGKGQGQAYGSGFRGLHGKGRTQVAPIVVNKVVAPAPVVTKQVATVSLVPVVTKHTVVHAAPGKGKGGYNGAAGFGVAGFGHGGLGYGYNGVGAGYGAFGGNTVGFGKGY